MKLTTDESKARRFECESAAELAALEHMERDENNPHLTDQVARVLVDRSGFPKRQSFAVGVFNANGVRIGLLCAIVSLALLSGCTRYGIKACSALPHTHQGSPDAPSVYGDPEFVACDTDADCERKNGGQY